MGRVVRTESRKQLVAWIGEKRKSGEYGSKAALAKVLGISPPALGAWMEGESRPEPHLREALELLSHGRVTAAGWTLPEEREAVERIRRIADSDDSTGTEG